MSQIAQRKRIFTTSALSTLKGSLGDIVSDITKKTLVLFDGSTTGGIPIARADHTHTAATDSVDGFESAADHIYLYTHGHPNATTTAAGFMSASDKAKLDALAAVSGAIPNSTAATPNTLVYRDANADFAGRWITGAKFIGPLNGNADTATNGVVTTGTYTNPAWIISLDGAKITGTIGAGVTFAGSVPWTSVTGKPAVISYFSNDAGYITGSGNTTGTSGGVQSAGGRETANPTANTVILRDGSGRAQVQAPASNNDIANKAYVDANSGAYGYYPLPAVHATNPFSAGTVSTFTSDILNESASGIIKNMVIEMQALMQGGLKTSNVFFGFTIDGKPETTYSITEFLKAFGYRNDVFLAYPANGNGWGGDQFQMTCVMDLPYKISCRFRFFTTAPLVISGGGWDLALYRYLRAS